MRGAWKWTLYEATVFTFLIFYLWHSLTGGGLTGRMLALLVEGGAVGEFAQVHIVWLPYYPY